MVIISGISMLIVCGALFGSSGAVSCAHESGGFYIVHGIYDPPAGAPQKHPWGIDPKICGLEQSLINAISVDNVEACQRIISLGASPKQFINPRNEHLEQSPIFFAVKQDKMGAFNFLTAFPSVNADDINFSDRSGHTPIFFAVKNTNVEMVSSLIAKGGHANHRSHFGEGPICWAARAASEKTLSENGKDIHCMPNTMKKYIKIMRALISGGADTNESCVRPSVDWKMTNLHGKDEPPIFFAIRHNVVEDPSHNDDLLALIAMEQVDVNAQNGVGETPIFAAVERINAPAMRALLNRGANIKHRNHKNQTCLDMYLPNTQDAVETAIRSSRSSEAENVVAERCWAHVQEVQKVLADVEIVDIMFPFIADHFVLLPDAIKKQLGACVDFDAFSSSPCAKKLPENAHKRFFGNVLQWKDVFKALDGLTGVMNDYQPWVQHLQKHPSIDESWKQRVQRVLGSSGAPSSGAEHLSALVQLSSTNVPIEPAEPAAALSVEKKIFKCRFTSNTYEITSYSTVEKKSNAVESHKTLVWCFTNN